MSRFMASNRRHPFEILSRLRHPSGRFKEMLFALSYTVALLGFFCFMNKVADEVRPPSRPVRLVSQPSAYPATDCPRIAAARSRAARSDVHTFSS
jgi:hypothetical protein